MKMNLTVLCKRILGLFILAFIVSIFSLVPVQAADKVKCENYLTNVKFVTRYNVSMEETAGSEDNYTISLQPNSSDAQLQAALRKVVFKVVKINDTVQDGSKIVKYQSPVSLPGQYVKNAEGDKEMIVTLESTESNVDPACDGKVTFKVGVAKGGDAVVTHEKFDPIKDEFGQTDGMTIDCSKQQTGAFEQAFCKAKLAVINNSSSKFNYSDKFAYSASKQSWVTFQDLVKEKEGEGKYAQLKCDVNKFDTTNGYYVNTSYLYGSGQKTVNKGNYTYHYSPGTITTGSAVKCKVKCEESVTVEYGPPIASKAGLCFEYKVKVTSRVSCSMSEKPKVPEYEADYCTPTPLCKGSEHSVIVTNQGGPNEDFDACVKACDGGKYTDKCSDKCYKKVYGTSNTKKTNNNGQGYNVSRLAGTEGDPFSLKSCIAESKYDGCYYRKNGAIYWEGKSNSTPGRWYLISPHKDLSSYGVFGNGIYRHIYSSGGFCHDICWWSGCSGANVYLNPGVAKKDYEANKKLYEEAVQACKATATCTTTTAEFTISAKYTDGAGTVKEIIFPYTSNNDGKDRLTSQGKGNGTGENTSTNKTTTILDYSGCYKEKEAYKIYMTEWSFPGSWIHNKTGEISWVNKGTDKKWQAIKNKFCIPLDAQDVNQEWWDYYYYKTLSKTNSSITSKAYQENCANKGYGFKKVETFDEKNVKPNIIAKTENFGYFGWNIQISCFYALNTKSQSKTNSKDVPEECRIGSQSYRIRSTDLNNLFPDTDGDGSRAPGFNWSEYATLAKTPINAENGYYTIKPAEYAQTVQELGNSVYSSDYLDYEFNLTRSVIAELKKENKAIENNYSDYGGNTSTNYVVNYHSPLFRDGGVLSNSSYPDYNALKCNNIGNHTKATNYSAKCADFTGEVE